MEIIDSIIKSLFIIIIILLTISLMLIPTIVKWAFRYWFIRKIIKLLEKK